MADTETRTRISQVGTVFVPVADQDRALEFYLDKLGFEKRADFPYGEGSRIAALARKQGRGRDRDDGGDRRRMCGE
jgi:catechol 2,3-dioxygenase-like lactoylglutathione lyase family enzyme